MREALGTMQEMGLITGYKIDEEGDRLEIARNKEWYRDRPNVRPISGPETPLP
jgi:hypothetical protein